MGIEVPPKWLSKRKALGALGALKSQIPVRKNRPQNIFSISSL